MYYIICGKDYREHTHCGDNVENLQSFLKTNLPLILFETADGI